VTFDELSSLGKTQYIQREPAKNDGDDIGNIELTGGGAGVSTSSDSSGQTPSSENKHQLSDEQKTALMFGTSLVQTGVGLVFGNPGLAFAGLGTTMALGASKLRTEASVETGASPEVVKASPEAASERPVELEAASAGVQKGETLRLDRMTGILNTQDPAIRSQLEALGLTDGQLNNPNTIFAIAGEAGDKHLTYRSQNDETGERFGSVKLDPSKDNFGIDFSKGGLGASNWRNYKDEARNNALLSSVKGANYDAEIARRGGFENSEAFRTSEMLKSQLTALKESGLGDSKTADMLSRLGEVTTEEQVKKIGDEFMSNIKNNESSAAYLAGRRHGSMIEAAEIHAGSSQSQQQLSQVTTAVSQNLLDVTSDGDNTGLNVESRKVSDAEIIHDYEAALQAMLDNNTSALQKLDEVEQKHFTETHQALQSEIAKIQERTDLSSEQKTQIQNIFNNYNSLIGENGEGSEY